MYFNILIRLGADSCITDISASNMQSTFCIFSENFNTLQMMPDSEYPNLATDYHLLMKCSLPWGLGFQSRVALTKVQSVPWENFSDILYAVPNSRTFSTYFLLAHSISWHSPSTKLRLPSQSHSLLLSLMSPTLLRPLIKNHFL